MSGRGANMALSQRFVSDLGHRGAVWEILLAPIANGVAQALEPCDIERPHLRVPPCRPEPKFGRTKPEFGQVEPNMAAWSNRATPGRTEPKDGRSEPNFARNERKLGRNGRGHLKLFVATRAQLWVNGAPLLAEAIPKLAEPSYEAVEANSSLVEEHSTSCVEASLKFGRSGRGDLKFDRTTHCWSNGVLMWSKQAQMWSNHTDSDAAPATPGRYSSRQPMLTMSSSVAAAPPPATAPEDPADAQAWHGQRTQGQHRAHSKCLPKVRCLKNKREYMGMIQRDINGCMSPVVHMSGTSIQVYASTPPTHTLVHRDEAQRVGPKSLKHVSQITPGPGAMYHSNVHKSHADVDQFCRKFGRFWPKSRQVHPRLAKVWSNQKMWRLFGQICSNSAAGV